MGKDLNCGRGEWENTPGADYWVTWYRSNKVGPEHPHYRAPSQIDLGSFTTPADPQYGTQDLTWLDSLIVGQGKKYTPTAADVGKVIHCAVNANNGGATVWATAEGAGDHRLTDPIVPSAGRAPDPARAGTLRGSGPRSPRGRRRRGAGTPPCRSGSSPPARARERRSLT